MAAPFVRAAGVQRRFIAFAADRSVTTAEPLQEAVQHPIEPVDVRRPMSQGASAANADALRANLQIAFVA
jgi:hypothetical protein